MKKNKTVKIQYQDYLETYTAHIEKNGDGWVVWIQEVPELKREKDTREELLKTLKTELHETLADEWETWCEQFEEDVKARRLDRLFDEALEDLRAGRCKDL